MSLRAALLTLFSLIALLHASPASAQSSPPPPTPPSPRAARGEGGCFLRGALRRRCVECSRSSPEFYLWTDSKEDLGFRPLEKVVFPQSRRHEVLFESSRTVGDVRWNLRRFRGEFLHDWNLSDFPFDKHMLQVPFRDGGLRTGDIKYVLDTENSGMSSTFKLPGWRITDFKLSIAEVTYPTTFGEPGADGPKSFQRITAAVVMERDAFWLFLKLISGGYIAFAAAMLACLMKTTQPPVFSGRMVLQISCIFAAILNNRATDSSMGREDMFTLPDVLHLFIYFFIFIAMLITLRSRVLCERGQEAAAVVMERRGTVILVAAFVVLNVIMVWRAALSPIQNLIQS